MKQGYRNLFGFLVLALVLGLVFVGQAPAQVISGDLVGTILDKTGAAVPNASVEAVNAETGVKYSTQSDAAGEYRFTNLPVGVYNVSAWAANFAKTTVSAFKIELNKTTTLAITLDVKGAVTSIEVSGAAVALDTTTATVSNTFEEKLVSDIPAATTGSGVLNLSLLSSGVSSSGGVGVGSGPSVGGQRPRNNNFTIEGVDNNNKAVTGPLVVVPNDAVAEFSLLQNQYSPEFGHSTGGQFNTIVKSGTNSYHGLAYIYNNNRNYNALDTIQALEGLGTGNCPGTPCNSPGPRYDFNRIGGQFGGPILKNKLFFFANYEYDPLGQAGGAGAVCAPSAAGLAVINSYPGLSATNVAQFEKYVPAGTLTGAGCDPLSFPNPTDPAGAPVSVETLGLAVVSPSFQNGKYLTTSMDYNISTKDQLRGRYIYNSVVGIDTAANLPVFFTPFPNKFHLVAINEYHTFGPSLTNEFRVGFNRFAQTISAGNFSYPGLDSFPNLQFNDLGFLQVGPDPNGPQFTIQNTYQLADSITWTHGAHTLKFGIEGRKIIAPQNFTQRSRGDYEYTNVLTFFQDGPADSLAERSGGNSIYYGDNAAIYWFVNDDWRITHNLTINLGLRYEYTTISTAIRQQTLNQIASVPGLIEFNEPQAPKNNYAPRIGFAYSPGTSGRTSIRGGAGIAYDIYVDNFGLLSLPPELSSTIDCAPVGSYNCPNPFLAGGGILPGNGGITTFTDPAEARAFTSAYVPVDQKSPKSIDWTLGIQHTFWKDFTVEARYLGTRGIHLPAQIQINKQSKVSSSLFLPTYTTLPDQATLDSLTTTLDQIKAQSAIVPAYNAAGFNQSNITAYEPWASSTYHGLATQVNKRFSHGFQFIGAYTYSHLIDDATAEVFSTVLAPRRAQDSQDLAADRANSILDHRHRFTLAGVYDLPYFKQGNWVKKNLIGNWQFTPAYTYQSGQWVTAQSGIDSNLNGDSAPDRTVWNASGTPGTGSAVNPLFNSGGAIVGYCACSTGSVNDVPTNSNAQYIQAGSGALATTGRNTLQLKPINDLDFAATKRFAITERYKVEFSAQFANLLNHPQYVGGFINDIAPVGFTGSQRNMLIPGSSDFNDPSSVFASNARTMQLTLKFFF